MLMGLDFYIQVCDIVERFKETYDNKSVKMIFQTNALLINREWINFFKEHDIHVGTSFDGVCNELTRGNTENILKAYDLMKQEKLTVGAINVVTSQTLPHLFEDYAYYKENRINVKFNPVFRTDLTLLNEEALLTVDSFIETMLALLDEWFYDLDCNISVEPFADFCLMALGRPKSCSFRSCLLGWLCIDGNGDITPCGRNYPEEFSMGNVRSYSNIQESFYSPGYVELLRCSVQRRAHCKANCDIFEKCRGGCPNDALIAGDLAAPDDFHCKYVKAMLSRASFLLKNAKEHNLKINPYVEKILNEKSKQTD